MTIICEAHTEDNKMKHKENHRLFPMINVLSSSQTKIILVHCASKYRTFNSFDYTPEAGRIQLKHLISVI